MKQSRQKDTKEVRTKTGKMGANKRGRKEGKNEEREG